MSTKKQRKSTPAPQRKLFPNTKATFHIACLASILNKNKVAQVTLNGKTGRLKGEFSGEFVDDVLQGGGGNYQNNPVFQDNILKFYGTDFKPSTMKLNISFEINPNHVHVQPKSRMISDKNKEILKNLLCKYSK